MSSDTTTTIIVRAFEDRLDLLRCLIGLENTPYEYAPFVIDWKLDSTFPKCPPIAHFLSWTNGNGRGVMFILRISLTARTLDDASSEPVSFFAESILKH